MNSRVLGSTVCLLASLLLTGCLSGGTSGDEDTTTSSTTTTTQSQPLSGVVADGYVEGAVVFFDRNANGVLDSGEPVATTSSTGAFTLTGVPATDASKYRVLVAVQKTAKDADVVSIDGATVSTLVPNEYYLSSPPGKSTFISPLSTLVDMHMRTNPSLTLAEAEADIKIKLGLTSDISLFADYIGDEKLGVSSTFSESKKAHKLSRLLANALGKALDGVKGTMGTEPSAANKARLFELSVNNVLGNLDKFVASAATLADAASSKPDDLKAVQAAVSTKGDSLKAHYIGDNLQQSAMILAQLTQTTEPKTQSVKSLLDAGVYSLQGQSDGTYSQTKISAATATTSTSTTSTTASSATSTLTVTTTTLTPTIKLTLDASIGTTTTATKGQAQLLGTDGQWKSVEFLNDSLLLQGATLSYSGDVATMTLEGNVFAMRAMSYDLAAKSLDYALIGNGISATGFAINSSLVFADKSLGYRLIVMPQSDAYVLISGGAVDSITLSTFLTDYAVGQKYYSHPNWSGNLKVQFASGADSGAIKLFDKNGVKLDNRADATWQKVKANGVEMLMLSALPDDYHSQRQLTPFVAVNADGKVASGVMLKKGMVIGSNLLLNKTAIGSIPGVASPTQ